MRTLSRLVFACVDPAHSTLKLFDPATGLLTGYQILKLPADIQQSVSGAEKELSHMLEVLKTAVRTDLDVQASSHLPSTPLCSTLSTPRRPSPRSESQASTATTVVSSLAKQFVTCSLTDTKKTLFLEPDIAAFNSSSEYSARPLSLLPPAPFFHPDYDTSSLADESFDFSLSEASSSGSSFFVSTKPDDLSASTFFGGPINQVSSPVVPTKPCPPPSTAHSTPETPAAWRKLPSLTCPLGLGFANLNNADGSSFDGLGVLPHDPPSPSAEALARREQRLRAGATPPIPIPSESPRAHPSPALRLGLSGTYREIPHIRDEDFNFPLLPGPANPDPAVTRTPISSRRRRDASPVPPAAPARRFSRRFYLREDTVAERGTSPEDSAPATKLRRLTRDALAALSQQQPENAGSARRSGIAGDDVRSWADGVGSEKEFNAGKPAWRP